MTRQTTRSAPAALGLPLLALLTMALAAGCAADSSAGKPSDDFEVRAMIASDRQQIQAMDERLRRIESQLQDLEHNPSERSAAPSSSAAGAAPATQAPPMGTPPAPSAPPGGAPQPPGAAANPAGTAPAATAAANAPAAGREGTTIATAPEAEAGNPSPPAEAGANEAASTAMGAEGGANPEGAENASNEEGESQEGTAEAGNPEAQPPPAPGPAGAETAAPAGGEEVASAPPSAPPENAPAAIPPARWPEDLNTELQSSANAKGAAGKLFRSGLDAMKNRNYSSALAQFATIQKKFPHSDLTEPAAYFSASALDEMGKYDQAILQYNDLVMRYPKGKYAGEALLREARAFIQINDKVDARLTLQKLINEHPGTPQAATAAAMIKNVGSE